jgi:hypothetical protein
MITATWKAWQGSEMVKWLWRSYVCLSNPAVDNTLLSRRDKASVFRPQLFSADIEQNFVT